MCDFKEKILSDIPNLQLSIISDRDKKTENTFDLPNDALFQ